MHIGGDAAASDGPLLAGRTPPSMALFGGPTMAVTGSFAGRPNPLFRSARMTKLRRFLTDLPARAYTPFGVLCPAVALVHETMAFTKYARALMLSYLIAII